ncbi:uncharacterized protein LOC128723751 [Anopheles nili]|uniref:uncharacterized protein LOC128723751 n=1 Tax=Anopheles nili TaxID=185578 RepID=UPI00237BDD1C|nr:uncharacterized protein LOC128723751 [Anopheles nili]
MAKTEILKGKMPVALLQEMCFKVQGPPPIYQYLGEESVHFSNTKKFTHAVSALGKIAKGAGRSKQESKHEAAWQLIRQLLDLPEADTDTGADNQDGTAVPDLCLDRVTQVRDICIQRNFPLPEFELVRSYGPSHAPVFEYECRIRDIVRRGTHSTKKGAKQNACQEMIATLQSMPVEESALQIQVLDMALEAVEEDVENVVRTYREYTQSDNKKKLGVSIADRHTFFLDLPKDRIEESRRMLENPDLTLSEKCYQIPLSLGLKTKLTISNGNMPTIKGSCLNTFELLHPEYDCFIYGQGEAIYQKIFDYFEKMLKAQVN